MKPQLPYDIFISGHNIDLFVLTEEHALYTDWYNWFNDASTNLYTNHHYFPNTAAKQRDFFKTELENSQTKLQLGMMDKEGLFFGVVSLSNINYRSQNAEIGLMVGNKKCRLAQYTIEGLSLIINHGFSEFNLRRVYGGTQNKQVAELCVKGLNFSHEGVLRQHIYKNNNFVDCYLVGLLKEDFQPLVF